MYDPRCLFPQKHISKSWLCRYTYGTHLQNDHTKCHKIPCEYLLHQADSGWRSGGLFAVSVYAECENALSALHFYLLGLFAVLHVCQAKLAQRRCHFSQTGTYSLQESLL